MNENNYETIVQALDIIHPALSKFIGRTLSRHIGLDNWWKYGVYGRLDEVSKKSLPSTSDYDDYDTLVDKLKLPVCLELLEIHKQDYFRRYVPENFFNWLTELGTIRKQWHDHPEFFDDTATARALDTMILIADKIDATAADKLRALKGDKPKPQVQPQPKRQPKPQYQPQPQYQPTTPQLLYPWRSVITPNSDVTRGEYRQSDWMVNLGNVIFKREGRPEYLEPVEFFSRTYLTGGLKGLLVEVLQRLTNGNGEPVIQLKTAFGGGKTHSLLALHHLFNGQIQPEQSEAVSEVLKAANVATLPKVNKVVFVGTWPNPLKSTLWGEITAQLAGVANKPELNELIRENERLNVPPGAELMKEIFDAAAPCLILIDELVAYGRALDGDSADKMITFCQQLTEAAAASPRTSLVVTIPQSDAEVGDDRGKAILRQVEKIFGRVEFVWRSVSKDEGYEIVRRRLFGQCDEVKREKVCAAFFDMYCDNANDFPADSSRSDYKNKLLSFYPIHPELFEFLYEKWTSLERFQKTRGVLRLMSEVVYNLWQRGDTSAMIMPCDIPLDAPEVHGELTKLFEGNWDAIVDSEIDGLGSKAHNLERNNPRFGNLQAARKISRSIFMGTAPVKDEGGGHGLTENAIHLCTIEPSNVKDIAIFNDALSKLRTNLHYLHSNSEKFWFSTTATLRKIIDDKREKYSDTDIFYEMEQRLKSWEIGGKFAAVYVCPKSSADVPDDMTARLVVLSPKNSFDALNVARDFLDNRGNVSREWKNMLLFLAADDDKLDEMKDIVREFKAWSEVSAERRTLRLDVVQAEEVDIGLASAKKDFTIKLSQAYCRLIYPVSDDDANLTLPLKIVNFECTAEDNISVAYDKFTGKNINDVKILFTAFGGDALRREIDKRSFVWQGDAVNVGQLWGYFAKYYYMPRLLNEKVLLDAVKRAVSNEIFALASDIKDGEYIDLKFGDNFDGQVKPENYLVKAAVAQKLFGKVEETPEVVTEPETVDEVAPVEQSAEPTEPETDAEPLPTKFRMDVKLDNLRLTKQLTACAKEILPHLLKLTNVEAKVRLVVDISVPEGVPAETRELVEKICVDKQISGAAFDR